MTPTDDLAELRLACKLTALRLACIVAGITAESPAVPDAEAELMARLEREDAQ